MPPYPNQVELLRVTKINKKNTKFVAIILCSFKPKMHRNYFLQGLARTAQEGYTTLPRHLNGLFILRVVATCRIIRACLTFYKKIKNSKFDVHQMRYFKLKMHQKRFRRGFCATSAPDSAGSLRRSPCLQLSG